jgi:CheY-like chemotaxis protein
VGEAPDPSHLREARELAHALRRDNAFAGTRIIAFAPSVAGGLSDGISDSRLFEVVLAKPARRQYLFESLQFVLSSASSNQRGPGTDAGPEEPLGLSVLLAEDNPVNQEVARLMLEAIGCTARIAWNGAEAVNAVRTNRYDVVLMDCQMPDVDGFTATRLIREWEAESHRPPLPIVALTANALAGDRERCLAAGMTAYLTKPFSIAQLREILLGLPSAAQKDSRRAC